MTLAPLRTAADVAEQDLLIGLFVDAAFAHRDHCPVCREGRPQGRPWCAELVDACEALLHWRERRGRQEHAAFLRACQIIADVETRARAEAA